MDGNILATIGSAIGVLAGVYTIVNRTEDRVGKRIEESKETLRAEIKAGLTGLELKTVERFSGIEKTLDSRFSRAELNTAEMEKRLNERIDTRLVHR